MKFLNYSLFGLLAIEVVTLVSSSLSVADTDTGSVIDTKPNKPKPKPKPAKLPSSSVIHSDDLDDDDLDDDDLDDTPGPVFNGCSSIEHLFDRCGDRALCLRTSVENTMACVGIHQSSCFSSDLCSSSGTCASGYHCVPGCFDEGICLPSCSLEMFDDDYYGSFVDGIIGEACWSIGTPLTSSLDVSLQEGEDSLNILNKFKKELMEKNPTTSTVDVPAKTSTATVIHTKLLAGVGVLLAGVVLAVVFSTKPLEFERLPDSSERPDTDIELN